MMCLVNTLDQDTEIDDIKRCIFYLNRNEIP